MRPIGFIPMGRFCLDQKHYPLPYPVIIAATKGEPQAMNIVVQHYTGYIARLSMRKLRDERGNTYYGIDEYIRDRPRSKLMQADPAIS